MYVTQQLYYQKIKLEQHNSLFKLSDNIPYHTIARELVIWDGVSVMSIF